MFKSRLTIKINNCSSRKIDKFIVILNFYTPSPFIFKMVNNMAPSLN